MTAPDNQPPQDQPPYGRPPQDQPQYGQNAHGQTPSHQYPPQGYPAQQSFQQSPQWAPPAQKDTVIAYALWFLLGQLGLHKFYVRNNTMGAIYLGLGVVGWLTSWLLIGFLLLFPLWILLLVDLFTLPEQVRRANSTPEYR